MLVPVIAVVSVLHQLPLKLRVAGNSLHVDGLLCAVAEGVSAGVCGNGGFRLFGIFMELDDLRHRRCHTAGSRISLCAVFFVVQRAGEVVGVSLIPSCGEQFADAVLGGLHFVAFP